MAEADYYGVLGVEKKATLQEIRTKFRQQVLAEHPDKGGDPKKFQLLNKAYNVLTDPEKRRRYDTTGKTEKTAVEEFVESFGGGRINAEQRPKDADDQALVNLQDRIQTGPSSHEDGFAEWLRQRDQSGMVLTDSDFMKTALFNAAELSTDVKHASPVQHVFGSPKTDAYGQSLSGAVQVQVKKSPPPKSIDHDQLLVRIVAVPVDNSMVFAELSKPRVCLGMTGVGRVEQVGTRIENFKHDDFVLVLPKPTKFSPDRPVGTARTLLVCSEEDLIHVPAKICEELSPEQISLTPTIACAYILLEKYGAKLKPGDSLLLNAAHLSVAGSALLQLCRLLKLKPMCLLSLPGAPKHLVEGEYGSKAAWQDVDTRNTAPQTVRAQYERISEQLMSMGAEEVFADAVALHRWRDRNQRMLPKVALDGVSTRESAEQLIHCLQPGDNDAVVVVYGHGTAQPIQISPPLLAAWGGSLSGFNVSRWVHALTANAEKMMSIMENVMKLVRAGKFQMDTARYNVGEDSISDAFSKAADALDSSQVVLMFPTLEEEERAWAEEQSAESRRAAEEQKRRAAEEQNRRAEEEKRRAEDEERDALKKTWLDMLFTSKSVAAMSADSEGALPVSFTAGSRSRHASLLVWVGDDPESDRSLLKSIGDTARNTRLVCLGWPDHTAGEALVQVNVNGPDVLNGSWYSKDQATMANEDLDILHDIELLARALVAAVRPMLEESGLTWKNVTLAGFGKGAGVALYATLCQVVPEHVAGLILFAPVVAFPRYLEKKMQELRAEEREASKPPAKMFGIWGSKDRSTPASYRQLLMQVLSKVPESHYTAETLPDAEHAFDSNGCTMLGSLMSLISAS